jgi:CubicO group peptidase (beta-lactamase class C family)
MHSKSLLLLALLPAFIAPLASAALPATGPAIPGFESYDVAIPALLERASIPGAAIAVAYRGRIVFARGYGYADRESRRLVQPDTRFRIGSISKVLTATTVLSLVDHGQLSLEDRAFPLLGYPTPSYAGARRDPRLDQVTVRQLLSHTGGWDCNTAVNPLASGNIGFDPVAWQAHIARAMGAPAPASAETTVRFMVGQPLQAQPGSIWMYTNFGYLALGRIIEARTNRPYEEAVGALLARSYVSGLAIGGTRRAELAADEAVYYDRPGAPTMYLYNQFGAAGNGEIVPQPYGTSLRSFDGSGGWIGSAVEVLRFLLALDGLNGTPAPLSAESLTAMRTATPLSTFLHYGLGWCTRNAENTDPQGTDSGHGGDHFGSKAWALRSADGDWHIVALINSNPENPALTATINELNQAAAAALHQLPTFTTAPTHDLTWSTLGWPAWLNRWLPSGSASELDDPDHDGLANLLEYAAGLDPTRADPVLPASLDVQTDGRLLVTYRRLILGHALSWQLETSVDGTQWQPAEPQSAESTQLNQDGTVSVSIVVAPNLHVRLRINQPGSGVSVVLNLALPGESWSAWWHHAFGSSAPAPLADPDGDGIPNLVEFAAGLDPRTRDAQPAASIILKADHTPVLLYRRRSTDAGLTWTAEFTTDGSTWQPVGPDRRRTVPNPDGTLTVCVDVVGAIRVRLRVAESTTGVEVTTEPEVPAVATAPRLVNISARAFGGSGNRVAIGGFVVAGTVPKRVLIRAVGPSLTAQGIQSSEIMSDPQIEVHDASRGGALIAANDDAGTSADAAEIATTARAVGASALAATDATSSALLVNLQPGPYTFLVRGKADGSGVVLAEVYDADAANAGASFANISTRAYCRTGNGVAIGGFVVSGQKPRRLLVRAVGPTLATRGLDAAEVLPDPLVEVHDALHGNVVIARNDDWSSSADRAVITETAARVGAAPLAASDTKSAALLLTVDPGVYTFVVQGQAGASGIVLAEVYDAD